MEDGGSVIILRTKREDHTESTRVFTHLVGLYKETTDGRPTGILGAGGISLVLQPGTLSVSDLRKRVCGIIVEQGDSSTLTMS